MSPLLRGNTIDNIFDVIILQEIARAKSYNARYLEFSPNEGSDILHAILNVLEKPAPVN